ncbi:protein NETWORKED 3A-like [Papaver somniferum]|uniref:protein NETWORKED 3A-like n=1 Tax=Papaver somniferum TaxID=3469 RepID=UPI000E6F6BF8|nr:protein NETWORKED 3A-like [Papaver somniferum]
MENNKKVACSWWLGKHIDSNQSPWLQAILNDLDDKMKAVVSLIMQDDGDTFAQRAEMYYKNRTQLVKMMEEFHRSYRCLAERYDRLRPESDHASTSLNSFINVESSQNIDSNGANGDSTSSTSDPNPATSVHAAEDPESKTVEHGSHDAQCETDNDDEKEKCGRQIAVSCCENGNLWFDTKMQVSKLIEENIKQQSELIRRNNEKREAIKDLCLQLDKLTEENMILRSRIPNLKGRLLGVLLGCPSRKE